MLGFNRFAIGAHGDCGHTDAGTDHHFDPIHISRGHRIPTARLSEREAGHGKDQRKEICDETADHAIWLRLTRALGK